jgi:hypothetical protein
LRKQFHDPAKEQLQLKNATKIGFLKEEITKMSLFSNLYLNNRIFAKVFFWLWNLKPDKRGGKRKESKIWKRSRQKSREDGY